jgi:hypothetical protein
MLAAVINKQDFGNNGARPSHVFFISIGVRVTIHLRKSGITTDICISSSIAVSFIFPKSDFHPSFSVPFQNSVG